MAVATPERIALAEQVRELRATGITQAGVAERLGLSRSYTSELETDPAGSKAAARKERYRLPCPRCGALMSGSDGISGAPGHCVSCSRVLSRVWTREAVIHALHRWYAKHGRAPTTKDWMRADPGGAWPAATAVYSGRQVCRNTSALFETWNDALRAADLPLNQEQARWVRWTRALVVSELQTHSKDGVAPGPASMGVTYFHLYRAAKCHFGSWTKACAAAGVRPRGRAWRSAA